MVCVGKLYQTPWPHTTQLNEEERAWISRYAWGDDYHGVLRRGLEQLAARIGAPARFESRFCVDTAPLARAILCADGGVGLDRQEYLPDQPAKRLVVFPGRTAGVSRDCTRHTAAGSLRRLPPLHRCLPDRGDRA